MKNKAILLFCNMTTITLQSFFWYIFSCKRKCITCYNWFEILLLTDYNRQCSCQVKDQRQGRKEQRWQVSDSGKRIKLVVHSYQLLNVLLGETRHSIPFIQFLVQLGEKNNEKTIMKGWLLTIAKRKLHMEQQTGSQQEKEYVKAVYCHPAYLTYTQSTS